ncbi:hypothetical protein DRO55_06315 [Candidatus Bathyarchaeota archaeon]|nr:MAG: hypothetical protein DRO55_06315 [Candidatus Bathyarchaeota archaeon]
MDAWLEGESTVDMRKRRTLTIAGTSILGALVVVFDYSLKFAGLKVPFPWAPFLKFDITGIPIFLALALYGLPSSTATSAVAFFAIAARSGKFVDASQKMLAEFSSILGASIFLHGKDQYWKALSAVCSLATRIVIMSISNLVVLPAFYNMPVEAVISFLPLLAVFNAIQGSVTFFGGYMVYTLLKIRLPSISE